MVKKVVMKTTRTKNHDFDTQTQSFQIVFSLCLGGGDSLGMFPAKRTGADLLGVWCRFSWPRTPESASDLGSSD